MRTPRRAPPAAGSWDRPPAPTPTRRTVATCGAPVAGHSPPPTRWACGCAGAASTSKACTCRRMCGPCRRRGERRGGQLERRQGEGEGLAQAGRAGGRDARRGAGRLGRGAGRRDDHPQLQQHLPVRRPARAARGAARASGALDLQAAERQRHVRGGHPLQDDARPGRRDGDQRHPRDGALRWRDKQLEGGGPAALARNLLRQGAGDALCGAHRAGPRPRGQGPRHSLPLPPGPLAAALPRPRLAHRAVPRRARLQGPHPREAPLPALPPRRRDAPAHARHGRRGPQPAARHRPRGDGRRRRRARGAAEDDHGLPDAHYARAAGHRRACRARDGRVPAAHLGARGRGHPQKEPRVRGAVRKHGEAR
mmetsp:Transcript_32943/g.105660  ORF Transcript_32943/g.105660 Transcript_32943/m.105660 type:complete len:366 (+) Transcript_32943:566-1663(+)